MEDENKFKEKLSKFITSKGKKINDFDKIIESMRTEIGKMIDSETEVDRKTTNSEIGAITESLEKSIKNASNFGAKQIYAEVNDQKFRLDNGGEKKGYGFWEIQRNGVSGKTTVAQVKGPDSFQILLNQIDSTELQSKYHELICQKLLKSLNSQKTQSNGRPSITKEYIRFNDLNRLFL